MYVFQSFIKGLNKFFNQCKGNLERKFGTVLESLHNKVLKLIMSTIFSFTDIQEFYELTLLDESKTVQQKTAETLLIASKWEQENSIKLTDVSTSAKQNIKQIAFEHVHKHPDILATISFMMYFGKKSFILLAITWTEKSLFSFLN